MRRLFDFHRRGVRVAVLAAAVLAVAGGAAYATIPDTSGTYTACMLNKVGTIRLIDPSLPDSNPMSHCTSLETKITFNKQGPQGLPGAPGQNGAAGADGKDGISVTSSSLPVGDPNCATGGSSFTAANATTYACNGAPGANGKDGASAVTARINNLGPGLGLEAFGPVSGVGSACGPQGCASELSPNSPTIAQDFAVRLTNLPAHTVFADLEVDDTEYLVCEIPAGQTTCTSVVPFSVPAASAVEFRFFGPSGLPGGDALIGWRLTTA